ncbi:uncharacterized protein LOC142490480 isoform X2 [Ascaphus truei]|uniref:uncharacterized protein LOC142490480 isoform X2 n=1 Tax=Ascaphus truei TaxID=8439 RepID=UPI003F5AA1A3
MSNYHQLVLEQTDDISSNQCLAGCMYQVVQASALQGQNVLQLIPVSKSTDHLIPLAQFPNISNTSAVNVKKKVCFSFHSPLPTSTAKEAVLQQTNFENNIITTQDNPPVCAKSIGVDRKYSPLETTVSHNKLACFPSHPGKTTYVMVNSKAVPVAVKSTPTLPSGHDLQIPANAEVKSVPASLPFAIQQKILAAIGNSEKRKVAKNTSVFLSPVNTIKTLAYKHISPVYPTPRTSNKAPVTLPLTVESLMDHLPTYKKTSPNIPMKWIVQENQESASCLVPVKSSDVTATKVLQILTGKTNHETSIANMLPMCRNPLSSNTNVLPIKDDSLVMYQNKTYLLTKQGSDVFDTETKSESQSFVSLEESTSCSETQKHSESIKNISNNVVEVVMCQNKPTKNLKMRPSTETSLQVNVSYSSNKESTALLQTSKLQAIRTNESDIICILDDPVENCSVTEKHETQDKGFSPPNATISIKIQIKMTPSLKGDHKPAVNKNKDGSLRLKFGLIKKERVVLRRIPLLRAEPVKPKDVSSLSPKKNLTVNNNVAAEKNKACNTKALGNETKVPTEMQQVKRRLPALDNIENSKRRKNLEGPTLKQDSETMFSSVPVTPRSLPSSMSSSPIGLPLVRSSHPSSVKISSYFTILPGSLSLPSTPPLTTHSPHPMKSLDQIMPNPHQVMPISTHSEPSNSQEKSVSSSSCVSFRLSQDPVDSFTKVSPANKLCSEMFSPLDLDETIRDEKIRRLKQLLIEREEALQTVRSQIKN